MADTSSSSSSVPTVASSASASETRSRLQTRAQSLLSKKTEAVTAGSPEALQILGKSLMACYTPESFGLQQCDICSTHPDDKELGGHALLDTDGTYTYPCNSCWINVCCATSADTVDLSNWMVLRAVANGLGACDLPRHTLEPQRSWQYNVARHRSDRPRGTITTPPVAPGGPVDYKHVELTRVCQGCLRFESAELKLSTCVRCGIRQYCSKSCQRAAWSDHRVECRRWQIALDTWRATLPATIATAATAPVAVETTSAKPTTPLGS